MVIFIVGLLPTGQNSELPPEDFELAASLAWLFEGFRADWSS
jgi:hypothetical protein